MRRIKVLLELVLIIPHPSSLRPILPTLQFFVLDEHPKLHVLPQAPQTPPIFDHHDRLAIGTIAEVDLVLLLQMGILEALEDAVPFALEPLGRLLVEILDSLGAVRVVALDAVADLGGELESATLLEFGRWVR